MPIIAERKPRSKDPILFLGIDGVLNRCKQPTEDFSEQTWFNYAEGWTRRYTFEDAGFEEIDLYPDWWVEKWAWILRLKAGQKQPPYPVWLAKWHKARLQRLIDTGIEIIWVSDWLHECHKYFGSWYPIKELPYLDYPYQDVRNPATPSHVIKHVLKFAGQRPFLWLPEDFNNVDYRHFHMEKTNHNGRVLRPHGWFAMEEIHFDMVENWIDRQLRPEFYKEEEGHAPSDRIWRSRRDRF